MPNLDAYRAAFVAAAVFAVCGAVLALRVPDGEAMGAMGGREKEPEVVAEGV